MSVVLNLLANEFPVNRKRASLFLRYLWFLLTDFNTVLPRYAMCNMVFCYRPVSVRPSVRLSVRQVHVLYPDG